MAKPLLNLRASDAGLLLGLCLCLCWVAASRLPVSWGWESGPLESFQSFTLLLGMLVACLAAYQQRNQATSKIWLVVSLFWLGMLGRELAWGAVFFPPLSMDAETGPRYTSSVLWWKPAVAWVGAVMLLLCAYWFVRYRLLSRVVLRWMRERSVPWGCMAVFVLAMGLSALAEGHAGLQLAHVPESSRMAMEEMCECWAYMALWCGQWRLVHAMQDWRSSSYLQTMHFALSSLGESFERRSV